MMMKNILTLILLCFAGAYHAQTWSGVNNGFPGTQGSGVGLNCLEEYNGYLFAGGSFTAGGSPVVFTNNFAYYDYSTDRWNAIGSGVQGLPYDMEVFNGELFVGGAITSVNGMSVNKIARWNGSQWLSAQSSFGFNGNVNALKVYNGELYAAGDFKYTEGAQVNYIAKYVPAQNTWINVGPGFNYPVNDLVVYNGKLIAGGDFSSPYFYVAAYDGTSWSAVSPAYIGGTVECLEVFNGNLYAGGFLGTTGERLKYLDGSSWINTGNWGNGAYILDLQATPSQLLVGGHFATVPGGTTWAGNIAGYDGSSWYYLGNNSFNGLNDNVGTITLFQGCTYVGGIFTQTLDGNVTTNRIARYCDYNLLPVVLESFDLECENNGTMINWRVTENSVVQDFVIEKGKSGNDFNEVGKISMQTGTFSYHFTDNSSSTLGSIYRLKMTDPNGDVNYSEMINANCIQKDQKPVIFPNPASEKTEISFPDMETDYQVKLMSGSGKLIEQWSMKSGENTVLSLSNYSKGIYLLVISGSNRQYIEKLIIQ